MKRWFTGFAATLIVAVTTWHGTVMAQPRASVTIAINSLGPETWMPQDISGNKYISSTIGDPLLRLVSPFRIELRVRHPG
jgi:hypothetical protein